ncbi:MAG: TPM domain-containing protein, partial [Bacteroidetes bacterium]
MDDPAHSGFSWLKALFLLLWLPLGSLSAQSLPEPVGFVNDYTSLLTPAQRNQLETYLRSVAAQTSNEISIAIIE